MDRRKLIENQWDRFPEFVKAEFKVLWEEHDALTKHLHLPGNEDAENDLIIAYESYFKNDT